MSPWTQRMLTVLAAVGAGTLAALVPATAPFAGPAAALLLGWAVPHTADLGRQAGQPTDQTKP